MVLKAATIYLMLFLGRCHPTESGGYCAIPFIFEGREYYDCIIDNDSKKKWCATTSNYDKDKEKDYCKGNNIENV